MNDKIENPAKWVSSLDIINETGISRATLNNYIKLELLPRPLVKRPSEKSVRARMLGYFPRSAIDLINQIKELKKEGYSMDEIAESLGQFDSTPTAGENIMHNPSEAGDINEDQNTHDPESLLSRPESENSGRPLSLTINDITCPAYLLNHNFEIDWINEQAENSIFQQKVYTISDPPARNIFLMLMRNPYMDARTRNDLINFHLGFVKRKKSKHELDQLYENITRDELETLKRNYEQQTKPVPFQTANKYPLSLYNSKAKCISDHVYYMVFREGILFIHTLEANSLQEISNLLSSRSNVINDLLKQRMPTMVSFGVLVADLQNSCGICAELPSEEYFELIHQIWATVEGSFKLYYGTYGKHVGDGMLYYFLKERDNQYLINAISCALEIRDKIRKLNMEWKTRKGWFNDLYLNIGINEGQEYFGTISSAPSVEFTALGDTVNYAGRLSDFARNGAIWTTKNLMNKLSVEDKETICYGITHRDQDREMLVENTFRRIIDMNDLDIQGKSKFIDISTLAITEVISRR